MTIGDSCGWGFIRNNPNRKTVVLLIQHLCNAASGEGNFLLNVGPMSDGVIPGEDADRLRAMGEWLNVNGEAIYGSQRCPFGAGIIGITTAKANTAYVIVFRWPGEEACIADVGNEVKSARVLVTGKPCEVARGSNGRVYLRGLPAAPPDPYATVIALELDGPPKLLPFKGPL
jgi:alpha-L-fucosidase